MTAFDWTQSAQNAAQAVSDYRAGTNPHWNDSYLNMGAQLMQQEFENQKQLELWNLMNEYNSPKEQMKRFQEAGLNPMLAYTQGTPGNANSAPGFAQANYSISPHKDNLTRIQEASQVMDLVNNVFTNFANMFDTGFNLEIKRNQVAQSNYEFAQNKLLPGFGKGRNADVSFFPDKMSNGVWKEINPFSNSFNPSLFMSLQRNGQLPSQVWSIWNNVPQRDLTEYRANYQKYYNENILPLEKRYKEGHATIEEIEAEMQKYAQTSLEMLPPEIRGILEPLVQFASPFIKFIFKSSRIHK